jgi:uncharacterized protein
LNPIINTIKERLLILSPEKIILFGSHAYGNPDEKSDIDILVVTSDEIMPKTFNEKSIIYLKVAKSLSEIRKKFSIDLIVHTKPMHQKFIKLNSLFAREIQQFGHILYEKNN